MKNPYLKIMQEIYKETTPKGARLFDKFVDMVRKDLDKVIKIQNKGVTK